VLKRGEASLNKKILPLFPKERGIKGVRFTERLEA